MEIDLFVGAKASHISLEGTKVDLRQMTLEPASIDFTTSLEEDIITSTSTDVHIEVAGDIQEQPLPDGRLNSESLPDNLPVPLLATSDQAKTGGGTDATVEETLTAAMPDRDNQRIPFYPAVATHHQPIVSGEVLPARNREQSSLPSQMIASPKERDNQATPKPEIKANNTNLPIRSIPDGTSPLLFDVQPKESPPTPADPQVVIAPRNHTTSIAPNPSAAPLEHSYLNISEPPPETIDEIGFDLRVERGTAETPSRTLSPTKTTADVTTQIASQLPQQLTKAEKQTLELRLDPPELGRVTIHLNTQEQQVTALITAERSETIELMRRHADVLTATLAKAGFSQSNLSFQHGNQSNPRDDFTLFQSVTIQDESNAVAEISHAKAGPDGRLDIRL